MTTIHGLFKFDRSINRGRYSMSYAFDPPVPTGAILRSEFENPLAAEGPLIVEWVAERDLETYEVLSPYLRAIQNGETYEVVLVGLDGDSNRELFRQVQPMRFYLPPEFLGSE